MLLELNLYAIRTTEKSNKRKLEIVYALVYSVPNFLVRNANDKFMLSNVFHFPKADLVLGNSTFVLMEIYWPMSA